MAGNVRVVLKSVFDDQGIKQAQEEFGNIGKSVGVAFAAVGAAIAAATAVAVKFGAESIKAAEDVAVANSRLEQINNSMGLFGLETDQVTDRLIKFAEANELTVAVDAEVIKATQAKLLTFKELGKTADQTGGAFDRATMAALDLAAAGFGSAETNAVQLGKALQDPIKGLTALGRAGVTFTAEERERIKTLVESNKVAEAQNVILKAIETQVGGTAAATAKSSDKIKLAFDNVKEGVGAALLPAFDDLAEVVVKDLAPALSDVAEEVGPVLVDAMRIIGEVIKQATDVTTPLGKSFQGVKEAFELLVDVLKGGRGDVEATTDTLGMFADILNLIITTLASFIAFLKTLGPALDALFKGDFKTFNEWLTSDPIDFLDKLNKAKGGIDSVTDGVKKGNEAWANSWVARGEWAKRTGQIVGASSSMSTSIGGVTKELKKVEKAGDDAAKKALKALQEWDAIFNAYNKKLRDQAAEAADAAKEAELARYEAFLEGRKRTQEFITSINKDIAEAQSSYDDAVRKANADYFSEVARVRKDYATELEGVILKSQARLTDAFRSAVSVDVGKLFSDSKSANPINDLIGQLRTRLLNARQLITNTAALASNGFSQTFIEQIVSSGAETGNQMAKAILQSTPETQAELKSLFRSIEDTSETGLNTLSKRIFEQQGFATRELADLYAATNQKLNDELIAQRQKLDDALTEANRTYKTNLNNLQDTLTDFVLNAGGEFGGLKFEIDAISNSLFALVQKAKVATTQIAGNTVSVATGIRSTIASIFGLTAPDLSPITQEQATVEPVKPGSEYTEMGDPAEIARLNALRAAGEALGGFTQQFADFVSGQRSFTRDGQGVSGQFSEAQIADLLSQGFVEVAKAQVSSQNLDLALAIAEQIYGTDIGGISTPGQIGNSTYNITVNAGMGTDPITVGKEIVDAIKRYERSSGQVFVGV